MRKVEHIMVSPLVDLSRRLLKFGLTQVSKLWIKATAWKRVNTYKEPTFVFKKASMTQDENGQKQRKVKLIKRNIANLQAEKTTH
ncbi:hypothetical protein MM221_09815 [Salipaludibacillus sp. LMS25]|uniref:hypothetical protein n=1 Tax=Salipaludibacillus sp. LMS25 TaxID=2924031 RepID=UPI0020D0D78A|nr:hypothetical protein [Salipaludibacillus sp. LMS25]UTR16779.1 hypothetical protein MM221_09815 [Salipaludibacillus sp. LMS25]